MNGRSQSELLTLLSVAQKHRKKYCWVSQKYILVLLEKYHGYSISRRTLNRDLRWLENNGFISRLRRHRMGHDRKPRFNSTLYRFTGKLFNWAYSLGNSIKKVFSFFCVPKWAQYSVSTRPRSLLVPGRSVENLLITERDSTVSSYNPLTGEVLKVA